MKQPKLAKSDASIDHLRACIDSAMGMVHELSRADWQDGERVPEEVMLRLRDHVISWRLECAGPAAVSTMQVIYDDLHQMVAETRRAPSPRTPVMRPASGKRRKGRSIH